MTNPGGRIRPRSPVELSTTLSDQLSLLAAGVVQDETGLFGDLTALVSTLNEAVSGYAGLRITIVLRGHPVQLSIMLGERADQRVVSSLRFPLSLISGAFEEGGRLVVWSAVPGSLVDLAADLGYVDAAGDRDVGDGSTRASSGVQLDADLPLTQIWSGVHGLDELVTLSRAAGLLIERGHDPGSVHEVVRTRAAGAGLSTHAWASRLLRQGGEG